MPTPTPRAVIPPRHRSAAGLAPILITVLAMMAATACSSAGPLETRRLPAVSAAPSGSQTPTASPSPSPTATPAASPSPGPSATLTLADYIARLPSFPPAPTPAPVALPHAAGRAAWLSRVPTTQPVAFLTIDDGVVRSPAALALMEAAGVPVTLFLTTNIVSADKQYFAKLQARGAVIENHTVSHPNLTGLSYESQRYELCHASDQLASWYGRRPVLFRPPYGEKTDTTLRAAWDCGLKAGLFWKETVHNGIVRYQTSLRRVQPGDIILMHFRPAFAADFVAALTAIKAAGLTPAVLQDYITLA